MEVIYKLIKLLHDTDVRSNVSVAPFCATNIDDARINASWYKCCDLCIAMRFHSNIICIQNNIPTIALDVDFFDPNSRLTNMYEWLECSDFVFNINTKRGDYIQDLTEKIQQVEQEKNIFIDKLSVAMNKVEAEKQKYFSLIKDYIR